MHAGTGIVHCLFHAKEGGWECSRCGRFVRLQSEKPPSAACKSPKGLGDYVADGLEAIGITKERVSAVVGAPCRCPERQSALNKLGKIIGIGVDKTTDIDNNTPP